MVADEHAGALHVFERKDPRLRTGSDLVSSGLRRRTEL